ncbi:MAG: hypothetical protein ABI772_03950 [Bacteroidota bacterium]
MSKKLRIVAFLLYISSQLSSAQPYVDLVSLQDFHGMPDNFTGDKSVNLESDWLGAQITYPHVFKDSSILAMNAGFEEWYFHSNKFRYRLNTVYLPVTYIFRSGIKSRLSFTAIPRMNGLPGSLFSNKNMQYGGAVIYSYKIKNRLKLKGGLYYNKEFFGNYFLPLAGFEWKATNRLYIFGLLPNNLFLDFRIGSFMHTGFVFKGITASYRLNEIYPADYFSMEEGQLKYFTDFYITKNIVLNLEVGQTVSRKYGTGFLNESPVNLNVNEGYFFKAGIYYRMWMK